MPRSVYLSSSKGQAIASPRRHRRGENLGWNPGAWHTSPTKGGENLRGDCMDIWHLTDSQVEALFGGGGATAEQVRQGVRHLLTGCELCSRKMLAALQRGTQRLERTMEGLPSPGSSRDRRRRDRAARRKTSV